MPVLNDTMPCLFHSDYGTVDHVSRVLTSVCIEGNSYKVAPHWVSKGTTFEMTPWCFAKGDYLHLSHSVR